MSRAPASHRSDRVCQVCFQRPALSARAPNSRSHKRGRVGSFSDHDTCRQCWYAAKASMTPKRPRGRMDGVLDDLLDAANAAATEKAS